MTALILLKDFLETQIEIWRPTEGFLGYEVSSLGRVRTFWRKSGSGIGYSKAGRRHGAWTYILGTSPSLMDGRLDRDGYRRVSLRTARDRRTKIGVHALVATAFVTNDRPTVAIRVNHRTNVHNDNRADNLEWCTEKENRDHAIAIGVWPKGEKHGCAKLTETNVREIRIRVAEGESKRSLARKFHVTPTLVGYIVSRRLWKNVN